MFLHTFESNSIWTLSLSRNNSHSLPPESSRALHFSRINPLLGSLLPNFIIVSGVPNSDSWQLGPPLPLGNPDNPNIIERKMVTPEAKVKCRRLMPDNLVKFGDSVLRHEFKVNVGGKFP
ncbi:uncharacterized protein LOC133727388 [Rosa rugosa]|uniref:uncharacterized protein LOC133727388 n=1 Tax=Rosa rugosa TaxID=74645 RepID=UPI002B41299D|nr:uncharacterized protein LOC133727388 [Rosa rugosa]